MLSNDGRYNPDFLVGFGESGDTRFCSIPHRVRPWFTYLWPISLFLYTTGHPLLSFDRTDDDDVLDRLYCEARDEIERQIDADPGKSL